MKRRRFALPAAFALTLLAFLLFGFTKTRTAPIAPPENKLIVLDRPPLLADPMPDADDAEKMPTKSSTLPIQAERFEPVDAERHSDFIMPPAAGPVAVRDSMLTIDPAIFRPGANGPGVSVGVTMVDASMLDDVPQAKVRIPPAYPAAARAAGITGEVLVEFAVDTAGRVHDPRVVRSTDRSFDEPTLRAVSRWVFEPGTRQGRPVAFRLVVPVVYRLGD